MRYEIWNKDNTTKYCLVDDLSIESIMEFIVWAMDYDSDKINEIFNGKTDDDIHAYFHENYSIGEVE